MPDVIYWERLEVVLLEEIIGAEAKQLKGDTNMAVVIKPVQHAHTRTSEEERERECKVTYPIRHYKHLSLTAG